MLLLLLLLHTWRRQTWRMRTSSRAIATWRGDHDVVVAGENTQLFFLHASAESDLTSDIRHLTFNSIKISIVQTKFPKTPFWPRTKRALALMPEFGLHPVSVVRKIVFSLDPT
jgi:hypothetical protein